MTILRGKPRSFGRGLLLTIVTLGIYPLYWHYKAFKELYDQEQRTDFPIGLYIASYIPIVNLIAQILFMSKNLDFVNNLRHRRNMPPIFGIGGFLGWYVLGAFIIVGPFVAYARLQGAINDLWESYSQVALQPSAPAPLAPLA